MGRPSKAKNTTSGVTKRSTAKSTITYRMKISLLEKIRDKKEILFGAFSAKITAILKRKTWTEIYDYAISINYPFPPDSTWKYLRDTVWNNIKKPVIRKLDDIRKTGNGSGEAPEFDELENLVLDIIGRDSAGLTGLDVPETWEEDGNRNSSILGEDSNGENVDQHPNGQSIQSADLTLTPTGENLRNNLSDRGADRQQLDSRRDTNRIVDFDNQPPQSKKSKQSAVAEEEIKKKKLIDKKMEKIDAQLELMKKQTEQAELQNYKLYLEIYEKELSLGLPHRYCSVESVDQDNSLKRSSPNPFGDDDM